MKYEIGGKVKISGEWYQIIGASLDYNQRIAEISVMTKVGGIFLPAFFIQDFIQDYMPPKPKPFDWLNNGKVDGHWDKTNEYLTDTYGDPTERVYRGEKAEKFGLNIKSYVNYWCDARSIWDKCVFDALTNGDLWRKMPNRITPIEQ